MRWIAAWLCLLVGSGVARAQAPTDGHVPVDRLAAYEDSAVGVRTIVPLGSGDRPATPNWDAFQGRDHHPISPDVFLRIVGRDDLARSYHRQDVARKTLMGVGGAAAIGGLFFSGIVMLARAGAQPAADCVGSGCEPQSAMSAARWGLAAAATGLVALIIGRAWDPTPVGADEAEALARDHDQRLRARLGLSAQAAR